MPDTQSSICTEPETLFLKGENTSDDLRSRLICEHSNKGRKRAGLVRKQAIIFNSICVRAHHNTNRAKCVCVCVCKQSCQNDSWASSLTLSLTACTAITHILLVIKQALSMEQGHLIWRKMNTNNKKNCVHDFIKEVNKKIITIQSSIVCHSGREPPSTCAPVLALFLSSSCHFHTDSNTQG